jgi:hypothetical protein
MIRIVIGAVLFLGIGLRTATTESADPHTSRTLEVAIKFERESLQGSLERITAKTGVPFVLNGRDLHLEGITGCQSYRMDEPRQPLEDLLKKMLLLNNADGKLAYTVKTNEEGINVVHIVTRQAAQRRDEQIFPEFTIESSPAEPAKIGIYQVGDVDAARAAGGAVTSRTFRTAFTAPSAGWPSLLKQLAGRHRFPIAIDRADLMSEGINGSGSFALSEPRQSLEEMLQLILLRVDPESRLVYTLRPNAAGNPVVTIVTRPGAEKRGEAIFPEFRSSPSSRSKISGEHVCRIWGIAPRRTEGVIAGSSRTGFGRSAAESPSVEA